MAVVVLLVSALAYVAVRNQLRGQVDDQLRERGAAPSAPALQRRPPSGFGGPVDAMRIPTAPAGPGRRRWCRSFARRRRRPRRRGRRRPGLPVDDARPRGGGRGPRRRSSATRRSTATQRPRADGAARRRLRGAGGAAAGGRRRHARRLRWRARPDRRRRHRARRPAGRRRGARRPGAGAAPRPHAPRRSPTPATSAAASRCEGRDEVARLARTFNEMLVGARDLPGEPAAAGDGRLPRAAHARSRPCAPTSRCCAADDRLDAGERRRAARRRHRPARGPQPPRRRRRQPRPRRRGGRASARTCGSTRSCGARSSARACTRRASRSRSTPRRPSCAAPRRPARARRRQPARQRRQVEPAGRDRRGARRGRRGDRARPRARASTPADLPHVFDRFYRAAAARRTPGSGLGLAIVRQAAEAHGGAGHGAARPRAAGRCCALPAPGRLGPGRPGRPPGPRRRQPTGAVPRTRTDSDQQAEHLAKLLAGLVVDEVPLARRSARARGPARPRPRRPAPRRPRGPCASRPGPRPRRRPPCSRRSPRSAGTAGRCPGTAARPSRPRS